MGKWEIHSEAIRCPECGSVQSATVEHTEPFWTWLHECIECGYIIMESDWIKED